MTTYYPVALRLFTLFLDITFLPWGGSLMVIIKPSGIVKRFGSVGFKYTLAVLNSTFIVSVSPKDM